MTYDRRRLTPEQSDYNNWPKVDITSLSPADQQEFLRRRDAVTAYIDGLSEQEISKKSRTEPKKGFRRDQTGYYLQRCLEYHPDGRIWGFRGLVPRIREKPYVRTKPIPNPKIQINEKGVRPGYAGVMGLFLREHPEVREGLLTRLLNRRQKNTTPEQKPGITTTVFSAWLKLAEKEIKNQTDYPFNVDEQGRRSIATFAQSLYVTHTKEMIAASEGPEVARRWEAGVNEEIDRATRLFQRVEIDPHEIDALWEIEIPHPLGGEPLLFETERIWTIGVLETRSRATLGYKLSLNSQPNAGDMLGAIENALSIWKPRELSIDGLTYPEGSGFPSGVIPGCAHMFWDETFIDNAWENLAYAVTDALMDVVGSSVNAGPVLVPNRRPFQERFHDTMEKFGFHQLVNTTASGPDDPKKTDPAKMARKYRITIFKLLDILDVVYAALNGREGYKGIGGRSPLQTIAYYVADQDNLLRRLTPEDEKELLWLAQRVTVTVQGSVKRGKRPYVDFVGAEYTNPILADAVKLIGQKIKLLVKPHQDIRSLMAFREDGTELGYLKVRSGWADTEHTLKQRQLVNRLIRHGQIASAARGNPIEAAKAYFAKNARTSRRNATHLANFMYDLDHNNIISDPWPTQTTILPEPPNSETKTKFTGKPVFVD